MYSSGQPIIILQEGSYRETGEDVLYKDISAAKAISDIVRSTLGPKGMDKMLVDSTGDVVITNDGATILKDLDIVHPAAKMLVEVAETLDEECGDGTTSAVVLAGELLKHTEDMLGRIHTSTITHGYRMAAEKAIEILGELKHEFDPEDLSKLRSIARTSLTGKSIEVEKDLLEEIAVKSVLSISKKDEQGMDLDLDDIKLVKSTGGSVDDSTLIDGVVLKKERGVDTMPMFVENAVVALLSTPLKIKKPEAKASISIRDPKKIQEFKKEEEDKIKKIIKTIESLGVNVLFCKEEISDLPMELLAKKGIFAVENVEERDMKLLSHLTGAEMVSTTSELSPDSLGKVKTVEEKYVSENNLIFVEDPDKKKTITIILRGGSDHILDEIERDIEDALKVLSHAVKDHSILPGGGATEVELSIRLNDYARTVGGREQMAIEAFSKALLVIPKNIAGNAGFNGLDLVMELITEHKKGSVNYGLDVYSGGIQDSMKNGVVEPYKIKVQVIQSAVEATNMILRIDDVIGSKGGMGLEEEE